MGRKEEKPRADIYARITDRIVADLEKGVRRWARRRHLRRSLRWVKNRYFHHVGTRSWVFGTTVRDKAGEKKWVSLINASDIPIRRHVKIKGNVNPFDPAWEWYFEDRIGRFMMDSLRGKKRLQSPFGGGKKADVRTAVS